jgi:hypothetical protein
MLPVSNRQTGMHQGSSSVVPPRLNSSLSDLPRTYVRGLIMSPLRGWGGVASWGRFDHRVKVKSGGQSLP